MPAAAQPVTARATLTTSLATIGAAVATGKMQRLSVSLANRTTTTSDVTRADVTVFDGTNTAYLARNILVGYASAWQMDNILLDAGWRIQATATAGTSIDCVVTGLEMTK